MITKVCTTCNEAKSLDMFYKHKKGKHGVTSMCISCRKAYDRALNDTDEARLKSKIRVSKYREAKPQKQIVMKAKHRAKLKNLPFDLTEDDIIIPEFCPILGIKLVKSNRSFTDNGPNLDRVKPEKGYVKGNVCIISGRANRIKSDASLDELEAILSYVKSFNAHDSRDNT